MSAEALPAKKPSAAALPTLLFILFINLVGFGIVVPLLPFYAQHFGASAVAIGFLCIRHPGAPVRALVVLIGIAAILFGAVEVVGAFSARHATKHWEAYKAQVR